jgi:predicted nucleic acid-binding protein
LACSTRMQGVLFDTSVFISALRRGDDGVVAIRRLSADSPLWLSAVVLEELYAGASRQDIHLFERLERDFTQVRRVVVPNLSDWTDAARILARLAARYHHEKIGRARLANDALIAMGAARLGITVVTENSRDFQRLAEFRPFQWRVATF